MEEGFLLRAVLMAYFVLYGAVRAYYRARTGTLTEKPTALEGILPTLRAVMRLPWLAALAAWLLMPEWLEWSVVSVPAAVPWIGACCLAASLALLAWVHHTLGDNFSPTLRIKEKQTLVTRGPYRWVRHPMYAAVFLSVVGICLVSSSWLIALISIPGVAPALARRMTKEEAMMVARFGDEYRAYMGRTGRVLPKFV